MVMVASYGDRLYEVSKDWSTDCSRTIRAASLMQEKLAITEEVSDVTGDAIDDVIDSLRQTNVLEEHPLESYCRSIEKDFANHSKLSILFEKVKEVTKLDNVTRRPPYSRVLLKSPESLGSLLIDKLDIPELARFFAGRSFILFLVNTSSDDSASRMVIFVKTCVAMARKERFADTIQRIFEKTINDTIPEISVPDRVEKYNSKNGALFWVPKMMRVFYGYIAGDPILKKEVDSLAAVMFPEARKEDLDFSNNPLLESFLKKTEISPIPLSEFVKELRAERENDLFSHLTYMVMVASYGDRLYEVSKDWSTDCSRTIRAAFLMQEKLAITEEVSDVMEDAIAAVIVSLRQTNVSEEHPLESYCRSIKKDFANHSKLSILFEKVKEVTKLDSVTRRPPYSRVLLKSPESSRELLIDTLDIPEFAKLFAVMSFKKLLDNSDFSPLRMGIFVKTCVAMAKKERFADSIQRIFEKTLIDTVPEIGVPDRAEKFNSFLKDGFLFWVPKMMRVFYGYIAGDPILKKEFDSLAAELADMKDQLRDVMFYFEAQRTIANSSEREEIAEGTIVISESPASTSKPKQRRSKKR
ncbi:hypothetical protein V9T40_001585 [Parthenolecanium corni]|uniref:Uncharacterized protein n=1 Tax=Parthenolecanium corni TaxID=536013 RepID=A0AAN9Y6G3_9HEMI